MRMFGKAVVTFGAVAAMVGCGPVDEAEQVAEGTEAQVADPRNCGVEVDVEQQAEMEARFELEQVKQAMGGTVNAMARSRLSK